MIVKVTIPESVRDPVSRKHRVACPLCSFVAVRAKRDAAEHLLSQHVAYFHEAEVER